jgi:UDP-N-acetyl-D-glucosamine dehydrogenase
VALDPAELSNYDCILIATDHSAIDYQRLAQLSCPVVDTRNAMRGLGARNVIGLSGQVKEEGAEAEWALASHG